MTELAGALVGWQLGASAAAAVLLVRSWRRRAALNEALHELRRPLQALALVPVPGGRPDTRLESSLRLATAALQRLEREINGRPPAPAARERTAVWPLLGAALARWRPYADAAGSLLTLRRSSGEMRVECDREQLSQAVDNLIVNAIEHGGPSITVEAVARGGRLCISVADRGGPGGRDRGGRRIRAALAAFAGRRRRGHGLRVVRAFAADLGGRFELRTSPVGSKALLELPLEAGADRE